MATYCIEQMERWLEDHCFLLKEDAAALAHSLVNTHKITTVSSLGDILNANPKYLLDNDIAYAYDLQIKKKLAGHLFKELSLLTAVEIATVFRNLGFCENFANELVRCSISGYALSSMPTLHVFKPPLSDMCVADSAVFCGVVEKLRAEGAPLHLLEDSDATPHLKTSVQSKAIMVETEVQRRRDSPPAAEPRSRGRNLVGEKRGHSAVAQVSADNSSESDGDNYVRNKTRKTVAIPSTPAEKPPSSSLAAVIGAAATTPIAQPLPPLRLHTPPSPTVVFTTGAIDVCAESTSSEVLSTRRLTDEGMPAADSLTAPSGANSKHGAAGAPLTVVEKTAGSTSAEAKKLNKAGAANTTAVVQSRKKQTQRHQNATGGAEVAESLSSPPPPPPQQRLGSREMMQRHIDVVLQSAGVAKGRERERALKSIICAFVKISNPVLKVVLESGLVPRLGADLAADGLLNQAQEHFSIMVLNHLVSTQDSAAIDLVWSLGVPSLLVSRVGAQNEEVREQALWLAGNLAALLEYRNELIAAGLVDAIVKGYEASCSVTLQQRTTDTICNFMTGQPAPPLSAVQAFLPIVVQSLHGSDIRCISNALIAIYTVIFDEDEERIQAIFDLNVVPKVVELMQCDSIKVVVGAEKVLENLSGGSQMHIRSLVDLGVLPLLRLVVREVNKRETSVKRCRIVTAVRTLCNICACEDQGVLDRVIHMGIFKELVQLCINEREDVIQVAVCAICFALHYATSQQVAGIVVAGALPLLCRYLNDFEEQDTLVEVVRALTDVLAKSPSLPHFDAVIRVVYDHNGWLAVDALRDSELRAVRDCTQKFNIDKIRNAYIKGNASIKQ